MLLIMDESHMTLPQLKAMPQADKARKLNLIKY
jgi:excinuclease UvrABC helicase subunit UvrB